MSNEVKTKTTSLYEQLGGTYTEIDGIFYPNVTLGDEIAEQNDFCGKYGDMWKKHMKHIDDDELMELSVRVAGKLERMSDEEHAGLVLEAAE